MMALVRKILEVFERHKLWDLVLKISFAHVYPI